MESVRKNAMTIASMFGLEDQVDSLMEGLFVVQKAPDYIFVLDRDAAISREGAQLAKDIMENELVMSTDVYKNGNLIYMAHPAVWYTAEGGITALDLMLQDLESELIN